MEKDTAVISRYHYKRGYYIEVVTQIPSIGNRDYWLCNQGSDNKLFMFSDEFKSVKSEEYLIAGNLLESIKKYERVSLNLQSEATEERKLYGKTVKEKTD